MTEWAEVKLGDLVSIKHGYAFKGEYFRDVPPGDVLLTPGNFAIGGGFQLRKVKYYDGPAVDGFVLSPGDLLVTMTDLSKAGDTLGYPAIVPVDDRRYLHNQRLGKVVVPDERVSKGFIYWLMRTKPYRDEVLSGVTGSTVKHTSPKKIEAFEFRLPSRLEQDAICEVLFALDDKIELNRRMNETLEAMAQAIFRDWFVDFGPVRRQLAGATDPVEIMGGVVNDVPHAAELMKTFPSELRGDGAAWEQASFLSLARLISGGTPKTDRLDYWNGPIAWASAKDVSQCDTTFLVETERTITSAGLAESSTKIVPKYSTVVVARGATTGRFCMFGRDIAMNQTCYGLQSRTDTPFWLNCAFRTMVSDLVQGAHGSVFDTITTTTFENARIVRPSDGALREFETLVAPIFGRILLAIEENRTLAETRDYLLPRLMSGEVRVGDVAQELAA